MMINKLQVAWNLPNVICVSKDESFFFIKAKCYDILCIFYGKTVTFFQGQIFPQEFLIISELNDKWDVKCILQPST